MTTNPYDSPRPTPLAGKKRLRIWARIGSAAKTFPATSIAIGFACVITALDALRVYERELAKAQEGGVITEWSVLDGLSIPAVFCAYVVVTITHSLVAAVIAGVLGMAITYGVLGLVVDLCWRLVSGGNGQSK